ncbi:hypothetical protein SPBR_07494 [Sporothrix brasiliensis 5110]|uniref:Alpha/beta hydrolase fold-3 domain-containing protein n=1 Tax=Sporothrix brasiliensis 5110 TaxID=1398154 RepID=A0A0C2FF63_9PEZI|nr:uncharacterized protein SPBR_07494 [Sporothrix brasiliensis 5110]KIH89743.1 hypothetical protein SPBR_07494 [Sporothrix brasiliensis 5110]
MSRQIYQPLHPAVRPLLDPQYVAFHDAHMQYVQQDDSKVWDGSARTKPSLPPGTLDVVPVGSTEDIDVATLNGKTTFPMRVFRPSSSSPSPSSTSSSTPPPIFVWCHGGGWAIGSVASENDFCTRVCEGAGVIVCSVGYRLAPEDRFPAAADDAYAALVYASSDEGGKRIGGDPARVAVGGTSAGATLSCVAALRQIEALGTSTSPLRGCLYIVPVVDNTATVETAWQPNATTAPWLTPGRMLWYRRMYMPDESDWSHWHASPNLAPRELLEKLPQTWVAVSEQDLLAPEGIAFAKQLQELGVKTELQVLQGCTHSVLALDGVMDKGKKLVEDAIEAVRTFFK